MARPGPARPTREGGFNPKYCFLTAHPILGKTHLPPRTIRLFNFLIQISCSLLCVFTRNHKIRRSFFPLGDVEAVSCTAVGVMGTQQQFVFAENLDEMITRSPLFVHRMRFLWRRATGSAVARCRCQVLGIPPRPSSSFLTRSNAAGGGEGTGIPSRPPAPFLLGKHHLRPPVSHCSPAGSWAGHFPLR